MVIPAHRLGWLGVAPGAAGRPPAASAPVDPGAGPGLKARALVNPSFAIQTRTIAPATEARATGERYIWRPEGPTQPGDTTAAPVAAEPTPKAAPVVVEPPAVKTVPGAMPAAAPAAPPQAAAPIAVDTFAPPPFPATGPSVSRDAAVAMAAAPPPAAGPPWALIAVAGFAAVGLGAVVLLTRKR